MQDLLHSTYHSLYCDAVETKVSQHWGNRGQCHWDREYAKEASGVSSFVEAAISISISYLNSVAKSRIHPISRAIEV